MKISKVRLEAAAWAVLLNAGFFTFSPGIGSRSLRQAASREKRSGIIRARTNS
jgi:hypothetical protein